MPFDRLTVLSSVEGLTTLSQVEGQIRIPNDRNSKPVLNIRISGFRFVSDFEFGASDFMKSYYDTLPDTVQYACSLYALCPMRETMLQALCLKLYNRGLFDLRFA
jgi:hypothetical protein